MKKLIFTLGIALIFGSLHAQNWTGLTSGQTDNVSIKLMQSDIESSVVRFNLDGYFSQSVATPRGQAVTFSLNDATKLLVAGAPDLLKATASVVIPDDAEMQISVVNQTYTEITGIDIAPSKGNLTRDVNPADVAYTYGDVYNKDRFFPGTLAELNDPYIIRDYRGQTVVVYPFQYNPVTKTLRVYTSIEVQITRKSANGKNKLVRTQPLKSINAEFSKVYKSHFLNAATANKYTPTEEGGNFLIISYGSFIPAIQPLKEWKQTIGVPTEIVDVSTIGNAAAIKAYILNYYNTNGLTYVLLVGDAAQVPTDHIGGNASDNSYSFVVGTDHNPDLFVGRFSAENIAHVQTQVQRTIEYEMGDNLGTGWLNNALCIGSAEGGGGIGDDDEIDWEHIRNIRTDLLGFTYATGAELYDGSQGGQDAAGDPNPASVSAVLNAGAGMIVYCGHGSDDSFVTTSFSSSNVNTLTNDNKLPFIFSVACVNGNFESQTCFAEAWMRATNGTEPTGAIATLMSTINQSWDPPMEGEDEMADILVESYTNNIKRTFGGISMNGCIKMNETYSSQGDEMTDTWNLFGDPSLMVRTDDAANMTVSHASTVVIGATTLAVNCDAEGAFVALTIDNEIIGTATVSGGTATVTFAALANIDSIKVAVTAFNKVTYLGDVLIIAPAGPYVIYNANTVNDAAGNNNSMPDFGESILLHITLQNVGPDIANAVSATVSTSDAYVTITDNTQVFGNIAGSASATENDAFGMTIANNVPDNHTALFDLVINDNAANTWNSTFTLQLKAPKMSIGQLSIDDAAGNDNGALDPGETVTISIISANTGHSDCNATGTLTSTNPDILISGSPATLGAITSGSQVIATFTAVVAPTAQIGSIADFDYTLASTVGTYSDQKVFYEKIGLVSEDWECGNFTHYTWAQAGNAPWTITSTGPYEGQYCAKSGDINDSQSSVLSVQMNVLTNDSISFYWKVSCEKSWYGAPWDYLEFLIDATSKAQWDGITTWAYVQYPVSAGVHTFKWQYVKDTNTSAGEDCAWIDYVIFPAVAGLTGTRVYVEAPVSMNIYPNPASEVLNVTYNLEGDNDVKIEVLNALGSRVFSTTRTGQSKGSHTQQINVSGLGAGVYFVKLESGEFKVTRRVILGH